MVELKKKCIEKSTLIRDIYRILLQKNRTYAAFEIDRILPLVEKLSYTKTILDPMSGYGTLIQACEKSQFPVSAFCIECNPPAHFWQILVNPKNSKVLTEMCNSILASENSWPAVKEKAILSDCFFPDAAIELLLKIYEICFLTVKNIKLSKEQRSIFILAILLPFVGRLSANVQGNIVTHVKLGGMVIFQGWKDDFTLYLKCLIAKLGKIYSINSNCNHTSLLASSMSVNVNGHKFKSMITSPPYPNSRSYSAMFGPENEFLKILEKLGYIKNISLKERLIGSPRVSIKNDMRKMGVDDIQSNVAKEFINKSMISFKGTKRQINDIKTYYLPLFAKYFVDLEQAYQNISLLADKKFEGYIIVVNNTYRKKIIPVASFIIETWNNLGFNAQIQEEYTRELSHVGGINPRVKGLSARHVEYTIKISN